MSSSPCPTRKSLTSFRSFPIRRSIRLTFPQPSDFRVRAINSETGSCETLEIASMAYCVNSG